MGLRKQILHSGVAINTQRMSKGMAPRPVRACVIGYPNVGKSSLINRILGRKLAKAQNVAGYTRKLQWIRVSGKHDGTFKGGSHPLTHVSIEMLDSPGIIPATQLNKRDAMRLAICNDIGSAAYGMYTHSLTHSLTSSQFHTHDHAHTCTHTRTHTHTHAHMHACTVSILFNHSHSH
jgi:ribosome biogenesis GTPase A